MTARRSSEVPSYVVLGHIACTVLLVLGAYLQLRAGREAGVGSVLLAGSLALELLVLRKGLRAARPTAGE